MNASILLRVGLVSGVLPTCWSTSLEAATDCVSALKIEAPETEARVMRERLQASRLSEVPAEHCRSTQIYLEEKGAIWQLQFTHGNSTIIRDVKSPEIAAVWVQSWLTPAASLDIPPPVDPASPVVSASKGTNDVGRTSSGQAAKMPASGSGSGGGAEGAAVLSAALGSLWLGPEARYHTKLAGQWRLVPRLGLAYAVSNRPENASRALRLSTALGRDLLRTPHWAFNGSLDVGFASLLWRDRRAAKHLSGPSAGLQFTLGYAVAKRVWIVGRVEASLLFADRVESQRKRVYFDDHSDDSERVDIVTNEQRLEATWVGALGLGILFNWGDLS